MTHDHSMARALRPARRRLRRGNGRSGWQWGLITGLCLAVALTFLSFLMPIEYRAERAVILVLCCLFLGLATGLCIPVSDARAARAADRNGLSERAQTALELEQSDAAMYDLQREDALAALNAFDARRIPMPGFKHPLRIQAGLCLLCALLLLLPDPQKQAVLERQAFRQELEGLQEKLEQAEDAQRETLSSVDRAALQKFTQALKKELAESRDREQAMLALSDAQERLEAERAKTAREAAVLAEAMRGAGLSEALAALQNGDRAALSEALQNAGTAALSAAAEALNRGNASAAAEALQSGGSALQAGLSQLSGALSAMKGGMKGAQQTGSSVQSGAQGSSGQGTGSTGQSGAGGNAFNNRQGGGGAGQGTSNEDAGYSEGAQQGGRRGSETGRYREKEYERIYDPTRLNASETALSAELERGEGDSAQAEAGTAPGTLGDTVPYRQVVAEYEQTAVQAADRAAVSQAERAWINEYFTYITQEDE